MFLDKNYILNKTNIINFLISFLPLSLILGNLVTNINIVLICLIGIFIYKKKIFIIKTNFYIFFIYIFFFYLIIITIINNYPVLNENELYKDHIIKSFFYLRFLILFLVVNKLAENNDFNTKMFFISCSFFSLIISVDIVVQFFLKKNIIGFPISNGRPSSFFNQENIAGGYLQKFSLFLIFLLSIKKKS